MVIGGAMAAISLVSAAEPVLYDGSGELVQGLYPLHHVLQGLPLAFVLVPAPVMIGVIIRRGSVFFEPPDPNRRMTLAAMGTGAVLGLWWLWLLTSITGSYIGQWW